MNIPLPTNLLTILIYYLIIVNIITITLFFVDKLKASQMDIERISESTLHLLELLGGIFSTMILIVLINHKSRKFSFLVITYIIFGVWIYLILKYYKIFI